MAAVDCRDTAGCYASSGEEDALCIDSLLIVFTRNALHRFGILSLTNSASICKRVSVLDGFRRSEFKSFSCSIIFRFARPIRESRIRKMIEEEDEQEKEKDC